MRDKDRTAFWGRAQKKLNIPETKCWFTAFLLLPSHRTYGIFGMGFP
jgi:hypothetical protein